MFKSSTLLERRLTSVEDVERPAEEQVRLDQVLCAKHVQEAELLQLGQLGELEEHLLLLLDPEGEEGIQAEDPAKAEAVHQLVDSEGQGDGIRQVDATQVQAALVHVLKVKLGRVDAVEGITCQFDVVWDDPDVFIEGCDTYFGSFRAATLMHCCPFCTWMTLLSPLLLLMLLLLSWPAVALELALAPWLTWVELPCWTFVALPAAA